MKRILVSLIAGAALIGTCLAQSVQSQASGSASQQTSVSADKSGAQAASASQLQAGSTVQAELVKPLDAHKNKVGDEVVAKTTHDVKSNGHVIVPKGSKLLLVEDVPSTHVLANGSWVNNAAHPATERGAPSINNLQIKEGSVQIGPFNVAGTYHLYCVVHPGMNLTIIVQ